MMWIGCCAQGKRLPITRERLEKLNFQILDGIPEEPEVVPGKLRGHNVSAGQCLAPHGPDVPDLVEHFLRWLAELRSAVNDDSSARDRFSNAILAAMPAHLYIAWIHPFGNGDGQLARFSEVQINRAGPANASSRCPIGSTRLCTSAGVPGA